MGIAKRVSLLPLLIAMAGVLAGCESYSDRAISGPTSASETTSPTTAKRPDVAKVTATQDGTVQKTAVGRKLVETLADLERLDRDTDSLFARLNTAETAGQKAADRHQQLVGEITTRLRRGSTPGNPVLTAQWNEATRALQQVSDTSLTLDMLSAEASEKAALGRYIAQILEAMYGLQGAVESDFRLLDQQTGVARQLLVRLDQLISRVSESNARQNQYVSAERSNMSTLMSAIRTGEIYGANLTTRALLRTQAQAEKNAGAVMLATDDRPLAVISFQRSDVAYHKPLYAAVSRAQERKPDALFILQAVSSRSDSAALAALNSAASQRSADDVRRALAEMGVPRNRIQTATTMIDDVPANEVRVYVR